jgi:cyclomaltodextrinase
VRRARPPHPRVRYRGTMPEAPSLIWHTYPLGVLGADQTGADRTCHATLRELAGWLPHLASLGADTLLLGPVFASLSHGYDTVTHRDIDDRLGTGDDFDALVTAASDQGIGVVLDGVFAYASREFWRLTDPAETEDPWFLRDADGLLVPWRVDSLVTPDYTSAGYQAYVADVMVSWLDRGARGWRLDSSWSVPASFWRKVLARVRRSHPRAWLLGQVFDDDLPPVINHATYSSATEYALMHGVREWLAGGPDDGVVATLRLHQRNSTRGPVHTFLGNHDFARLADVVAPGLLPAAFSVLMTVPGIPAVYYGDELAVTSTWVQGGSDAVLRPAMSPDAARAPIEAVRELGGFRRANPWLRTAALDGVRTHDGALTYEVTGDGRSIRVCVNPMATPVTFPPEAGGVEVGARGWAIIGDTVRLPQSPR